MNVMLIFAADAPLMRRANATKAICAPGIAALLAVISSATSLPAGMRARPGAMAPIPSIIGPGFISAAICKAWETGTLAANFTGASFGNTRSGFIGGGQIGYTWQVSPASVLGVE